MRLNCPFCGERTIGEFSYLGDAKPRRPRDEAASASASATGSATAEWVEYVYLRDNPAGPMHELWYHEAGCQSWLVVERDTRTHVIGTVKQARDA